MPGITHDSSLHLTPVCADLSRAERLIIRGLRRWLRGGGDWDRAVADGTRTLKPAAAPAFVNGLAGLAEALEGGARRMLRLRFPSCTRVSADERTILTFVGALQHDRFDAAHAALRYLIHPSGRQIAMAHGLSVAQAMRKAGMNLAWPRAARPPRAADARQALRAVA